MPKVRRFIPAALLLVAVASAAPLAQTQQTQPRPPAPAQQPAATKVTSPMQEWGKNLGDDYFLTNYQQLLAYWKKLDGESPRMQVVEIGKTGWGKPQMMAIITAPENFPRLERYKEISRRLALAEGLTDAEARALAKEGKSVVWIDGGLHATEVLGAQQLMEMVYQMVSRTDEETVRFLNDVILLCVLANPDGMDMVSDQYMKHSNTQIPLLYNRYAGHDDNRDSFMNALPETENISRVMFREWFPQVMYNHHQTGPQGTVMFAPPFRDPFNYNFHPMTPANVDLIGSVMATRFIEEGKPGVTSRRGGQLLDVVERRSAHRGVLPQHDRDSDRDHWQPDADADPVRREQGRCRLEHVVADSAAAGVEVPPVHRVFDHGQPRRARLRVAVPRDVALPHVPDGQGQHQMGQ